MPIVDIHPTRGLNPHLTFCPRCGGDGPDLILLGTREKLWQCNNCEAKIFGHRQSEKCPKCHEGGGRQPYTSSGFTFVRNIGEHEKLPGSLCKGCEDELAEHKVIVAAGGIYWKCKDCHASGVIRGGSGLAEEVRRVSKIEPPNPVGFEFTKVEGCPSCGQKEVEDDSKETG